MNSFSDNLVAVLSPVLIFVLKIPEDISQKVKKKSVFTGCNEGFQYLKQNHGVRAN